MDKVRSFKQILANSIYLDSSRLNQSILQSKKQDTTKSRVFKKKKTTKLPKNFNNRFSLKKQVTFPQQQNTLPVLYTSRIYNNQQQSPYVSILKKQITLNDIENSSNLLNDRLKDQQNIYHSIINNPYGKQSVKISEDVLQKYKQEHFLQQSRMLEKFQNQAKQYQKMLKSRSKFQSKDYDRQQQLSKQRLNQQLARMRQLNLKREQRQRQRKLKQLQKINKIGSMLNNISYQLDNNSMILEKGIRQIKNKIPKNSAVLKNINFKYADTLDFQKERVGRKIPLVIYENKIEDARDHYGNLKHSSLETERVKAENYRHTSNQYQQLLKILKNNKNRLNYLTKNEQKGFNNSILLK